MQKAAPLTKAQLVEAYPPDLFADKLLDGLAVVSLLRSSILRRNYTIPDKLNNAIVLSAAGTRVRDEMVKREDVPPKEAKLLTFLAMIHLEPLVDLEKSDFKLAHDTISDEIVKKHLLYPHIYGRELYSRAAELFRDEREYLRHEDTLSLLESTPVGVYHVRDLLIGPFGLIRTEFARGIEPRTLVPLQHCSDPSCRRVHRVQLTTSIEAPINKHRPALHKVLDAISRESSDWNGYVADLQREVVNEFEDVGLDAIPYLIGDALDDEEVRTLFRYALDNTSGALRGVCESHGLRGSANEICRDLTRAQILQLLMTSDDATLARLLDEVVISGEIEIPPGETRRLRVNAAETVTAWHLRPELSALGYRSIARGADHPNRRLGAVIHDLYDLSAPSEEASLAWLLRDVGPGSAAARLDRSIRSLEPASIVRRLVFARQENLAAICRHLGVAEGQDDEFVVSQVLWKLGFPIVAANSVAADYWKAHKAFERTSRIANGGEDEHTSQLRSAAADYAVALERYMGHAISYATWALLRDHYGDLQPFVFRESAARSFSAQRLSEAAAREGYEGFEASAKHTIATLTAAFGLLARELDHVASHAADMRRDKSGYPRFAGRTRMQLFPFGHIVPYLDLDSESQINLKALLLETTSRVASSKIAEARNSLLHANRTPVRPTIIADALDEVQRAFGRLEDAGLVPRAYEFVRFEFERWGRGVSVLATESGEEFRLHEPNQFEWLGMPGERANQFIVRGATLADGAQALRFRQGFDSRYEDYWCKFPIRAERGTNVGADRSGSLSSTLETGTHVSSRAD